MRVNIELPEQQSDPLLRQLLKQFEALQKQLMKQTPSDSSQMLKAFSKQQDALIEAMEKLVSKLQPAGKMKENPEHLEVMKSFKKMMASLPDDLAEALDGSYRKVQHAMTAPKVTVKPVITVKMPGITKQLNRLEEAMRTSTRSRNRTFGSNY